MKYCRLKDRRRRILFFSYERRAKIFRSIAENQSFTINKRIAAYKAMHSFPRDSFSTRRRNRCTLTGRSRAIYRKFGISRIRFRKFASQGIIPGIKKAS